MATFAEAQAFISEDGLAENGSVLVYHGEHIEKGEPYPLRSIAWRLLEDQGVGIAAFNTPDSRQCLSRNQMMEIMLVLEHAKRDPKVKVLLWTGTGTRAFNSGAALKGDMKIYVPKEIVNEYAARGMGPVKGDLIMAPHTKAFWDFPKPLVIAVNGVACGGGANIALANFGDVVLASTTARFMWPFAKMSVTPELGSSFVIPHVIGLPKAKELMMTGEWLGAEEAQKLNLINHVYAPEELLPRAIEMATNIASYHPAAMSLMKRVMNAPLREKLDEVLEREQATIKESLKASGGAEKSTSLLIQNSKL